MNGLAPGPGPMQVFAFPASESPDWAQHRRTALWLGYGLAAGLTLALLPPRQWSRLGAMLFGAGGWLLRSPLGPAVVAAVLTRIASPVPAPTDATGTDGSGPPG